jgi:hypothetical protein
MSIGPKVVNCPEGGSSQNIYPGTSFQGPYQGSKDGKQTIQIRETFMPTSGQAGNVQDQESEFISFSKPSSILTIANNIPGINMGKIIWQIRERYKEGIKTKTVKELMKLSLEFCRELIKQCIPKFYHRIFSILKPSKSASYAVFLA